VYNRGMKVYFGTSPRVKDKDPELIEKIYQLIEKFGYKHTSSWVRDISAEKFYALSESEMGEHHKKTIVAIKAADICVFEVSGHSLSVGYLANYALENGKVVVVLGQNQESLKLLNSVKSDNLLTLVYTVVTLESGLRKVLDEASKKSDVRFNFFVNPKILAYLDWVAQKRMVPRSVFLRNLIEREMKKDKEFKQ